MGAHLLDVGGITYSTKKRFDWATVWTSHNHKDDLWHEVAKWPMGYKM